LVLQFYGFVAGWGAADLGSPLWTALVCAALASFSIFLPSFVLVLALAPAVETVVGRPAIKRALEGVGAAVVGIIATFALGVARAVLFPGAILAPRACVIAVVAGVLLHRQRLSLVSTLAAGLFAGWMLL
jgi:chromate transporter